LTKHFTSVILKMLTEPTEERRGESDLIVTKE